MAEKLSKELTDFFAKEEIEIIAREHGFVERETKKLTGFSFLDTLIFTGFDHSKLSLNNLTCQLSDKHQIAITKQGLDLRFTDKSVNFMKGVLSKLLKSIVCQQPVVEFLNCFGSVRIKDSTTFQLPEHLASKYAGSGGAASKSQIRIQFEYDYKTGKVYDLSLHSYNTPDVSDAIETVGNIEENDLIIRDLGYIVTNVLQKIDNKGAWYLNRYKFTVNAYEKKDDEYHKLDFVTIYKYLIKNNLNSIEKEVYLGDKQFVKTRLIIELIPPDQIEKRLRKATENARKKGRKISEETRSLIGINAYCTNISSEKLELNKIRTVYRLRWQIEIMFKVWKSVGEIHKVKKIKLQRFETMLYAKLIWIMLNWSMFWEISKQIWRDKNILLSPIKFFSTLKERSYMFYLALKNGNDEIYKFINNLYEISPIKHQLEKKKNQQSSLEIMTQFCA